MSQRAPSPFSPATVLGLLVVGAGLLLAVLWMLASGYTPGEANDGGAHARGNGLNGYAALAQLLEADGAQLTMARSDSALAEPGLLVLTPLADTKIGDIFRVVAAHRGQGPVLVIVPKWQAAPVNPSQPGAKRGWVELSGARAPNWRGWHDEIQLELAPMAGDLRAPSQMAGGGEAILPDTRIVQSGQITAGNRASLLPLVSAGGRVLAGELAPTDPDAPLLFVFEPDLVNNYGLAHAENAAVAEQLVAYALSRGRAPLCPPHIIFDLTLAGHARSPNLLSLAFSPPYLAATLALLLLAFAAGWRAFRRFGPALAGGRAIAFGKRALIENGAALVRRSGRLHLLPGPYADAARTRLATALGLPRHTDPAATEAAIDRALAARAPEHIPFSQASTQARSARTPRDILRAVQTLHAIERTLKR